MALFVARTGIFMGSATSKAVFVADCKIQNSRNALTLNDF